MQAARLFGTAAILLAIVPTASAGDGLFFQFRIGRLHGGPLYRPAVAAQPLAVPPAPLPEPVALHDSLVAPPSYTQPAELFPLVKYKDRDEMHPFPVTTVVSVPDPRTCARPCRCCVPNTVNVAICVPPHCGPPRVDVKRHGREYEYDFGKYAVDVRLKRGYIEVDYQD